MKKPNKLISAMILVLAFVLFSSIVYAAPITDMFVGGLVQINNFFVNEQFAPYATAIDFFFFTLLFTAIYMMGARYAFKEIKRPEQVIVILLGLMTGFLLVLGGFSATIVLPYIQWLLYLLLFWIIWKLLSGIKNPFWRFILALLLTLLLIALWQGMFNALTVSDAQAPRIGGFFGSIGKFFRDLGSSFTGIELPGVGVPGVPDALQDLLGEPAGPGPEEPTGPEGLPRVTTPTVPEEDGGIPFWVGILIVLALLTGGGLYLWRRKPPTPTPPQPPGTIQDLINRINEIITKKSEAKEKIEEINREKNIKLQQGDAKTGYVARLRDVGEKDIANLFLNESRDYINNEEGVVKDIILKEWELIQELKKLKDLEHEDIYNKVDSWETLILQNVSDDKKVLVKTILRNIKILIDQNINTLAEDKQKGILWLIAFLYNLEKKENILAKNLGDLLKPEHIEELVKGKIKEVITDENALEQYQQRENGLVTLLIRRIESQIKLLEKLVETLGAAPTPVTPVQPPPTIHPDWPGPPTGKKDPKPPVKPVLPLEPVIPAPPKPKPTKHKDVTVDLSPGFLPIANQGITNACVAFAGTSVMEYLKNKGKKEPDLETEMSELFLWYNARINKNTNSGSVNSEVPIPLSEFGICDEKFWTWEPLEGGIPEKMTTQPNNDAYSDAANKKITGSRRLSAGDPDRWVAELLNKNPVSAAIWVDNAFIRAGNQNEKIYFQPDGAVIGGHAIVIVGFTTNFPDPTDKTKPIAAFKIRNSFGKLWGEEGYIWIPYDLLPRLLRDHPFVLEGLKEGKKITAEKPTPPYGPPYGVPPSGVPYGPHYGAPYAPPSGQPPYTRPYTGPSGATTHGTIDSDPNAILNHYDEIERYLNGLTSSYMGSVRNLVKQIISPMPNSVRLVICIPVAGHQEGKYIYESLKNYTYQTADSISYEIVVFVNHPDKDRSGKPITPDETIDEIKRFKRDYPKIPVHMIYAVIPIDKAKIGYVRKLLTDAVLLRHHTRGKNVPDLIIVSNDADNKGVAPHYIANFIKKLDANPRIDGLVGQIEWDPESYIKYPLIYVGTRLFQYFGIVERKRLNYIGTSGANFAFRSSIYAAIQGYETQYDVGEDTSLGQKIMDIRNSNKAIGFAGVRVSRIYTSSRRAIYALQNSIPPAAQWDKISFTAFDDEVRKLTMEQDIDTDYDDPATLQRLLKGFEWVINSTYEHWRRWLDSDPRIFNYFEKALSWIGIKFTFEGGKFKIIDMTRLIKKLKVYQSRGLHIRDLKSGKIKKQEPSTPAKEEPTPEPPKEPEGNLPELIITKPTGDTDNKFEEDSKVEIEVRIRNLHIPEDFFYHMKLMEKMNGNREREIQTYRIRNGLARIAIDSKDIGKPGSYRIFLRLMNVYPGDPDPNLDSNMITIVIEQRGENADAEWARIQAIPRDNPKRLRNFLRKLLNKNWIAGKDLNVRLVTDVIRTLIESLNFVFERDQKFHLYVNTFLHPEDKQDLRFRNPQLHQQLIDFENSREYRIYKTTTTNVLNSIKGVFHEDRLPPEFKEHYINIIGEFVKYFQTPRYDFGQLQTNLMRTIRELERLDQRRMAA